MSPKLKRTLIRTLIWVFLIFVAVITLFPFWNMLISSTHSNLNITTKFNLLPGNMFMDNYRRLTQNTNIWNAFKNSIILSVSSTALGLYFTAMAGYAFSKIRFPGNGALYSFVLLTMMIPGQLSMIGFYKEMVDLRLINSYFPLIITSIAGSFSVFFFKQYLDGAIPNELIEASIMDGCSEIRIFHSMTLPLMVPALATQGVLSFIGNWNSYLSPLILLNETKKMPLPVVIASIRSSAGVADYGGQYVGILLSVIPLLILFCFCSSLILDKISISSAVKG